MRRKNAEWNTNQTMTQRSRMLNIPTLIDLRQLRIVTFAQFGYAEVQLGR